MPLHMTSLVSRRNLDHPDEKPPVKAVPLNYERVLKYDKGLALSEEGKKKNKKKFGKHPGSMTNGKPTERSTFS